MRLEDALRGALQRRTCGRQAGSGNKVSPKFILSKSLGFYTRPGLRSHVNP